MVETVAQPIVSKISTGCGPSPPRDTPDMDNDRDINEEMEVEEIFLQQREPENVPIKISTSVGTSPPPQSAATQVNIKTNYI